MRTSDRCSLCYHLARDLVERLSAKWGLYTADPEITAWDVAANKINDKLVGGADPEAHPLTGDELRQHVTQGHILPHLRLDGDIQAPEHSSRHEGGDPLPETAESALEWVMRTGLANIAQHPEIVKPHHVIRIAEVMQRRGTFGLEGQLMHVVKGLLQDPSGAPDGPQAPPGWN